MSTTTQSPWEEVLPHHPTAEYADEVEAYAAELARQAYYASQQQELEAIEHVIQRKRWATDPVAWVKERTGGFLWSKQREILRSIRDHRKTAVKSCHGPGKSFTAAEATAYWLDIHPAGSACVVTTAPTDRQVKVVLWKEIRRIHARAVLPGRTNQKEWFMETPDGIEEKVAFGMKPADYDPTAFQGIHARYVLVILDEACGIPGVLPGRNEQTQSLWDAADSLLTNDDCRELAIGNPDDPTAEFAKVCRPGSGWNVITISAFETPNFTGEEIPPEVKPFLVGFSWVEEKRKAWAPRWRWNEEKTACIPPDDIRVEDSHPLWLSKVLGRFPENKEGGGLIPIPWIEASLERELEPSEPVEIGLDVGAGGDSTCAAVRRGGVIRIAYEDHNPNTMQSLGKVLALKRERKATGLKVDKIGIGQGIYDSGNEQGEDITGINVGEAPYCTCFRKSHTSECATTNFVNLRAQLYWALRESFEIGLIDLDKEDESTAAELCSLRYFRTQSGKIQIESKDQAKRRGISSPNRAEAVMLCWSNPPRQNLPQPARMFHALTGKPIN